jgi:hypothetical protein
MALQPDTWQIADLADGWIVRWRPPLTAVVPPLPSFVRLLPSWLFTRWGTVGFVVGVTILGGVIEGFGGLGAYPAKWPAGVGAALSLLLLCLQHYAVLEFGVNEEKCVSVRSGRVQTFTGVFPVECLKTLRLNADRVRAGRVRLTFTASSGAQADFVGVPGLSQCVAQSLIEAVTTKMSESRTAATEESRTKRCSGLAIKSGGVDNPSVASR